MDNNFALFESYEGNGYYIAAFCAKNDFSRMINVLNTLNKKGYNIWYDEENLNNDSLDLNSPYKFLDPKCKEIFLFLSSESEKSEAISRLLSYILKTSPQNVYCILLEQTHHLGKVIIQKTSSLKITTPNNMENLISAECKKIDIVNENKPDNGISDEGLNNINISTDNVEVQAQDFIYEKTPDGVKITKYIGSNSNIVIPSSVDGYDVTEISGFVFSAKTPITITIPLSVKAIAVSAFSFKNDNVTIKCGLNSVACKFANINKIKYIDTDNISTENTPENVTEKFVGTFSERRRLNLKLDKDYKEPYIFASFSIKDFPVVRQWIDKLTFKGFRVYVPETFEDLTEEELSIIEKKIFESRYFMAFVTSNYNNDSFCKMSLRSALAGNGEYYPVILDDTNDYITPSELNSARKLEIKKADFNDDDTFFNSLIRPLNQCCGNFFMKTDNFKYKIENNKVVIKKYIGTDESVVIENTYLNTPIVEIGEFAFSNCSYIKEITLPDSITSIGGFAFSGCTRLKKINIPSSTQKLGSFVFNECKSLTSIVIPNDVSTIPDNAFSECSALESVVLPNDLLTIGKYAFKGCTALKDVEIPLTVTFIDDFAFSKCPNIIKQGLPGRPGLTVSPDALANPQKLDFVIDETDPEQFNYYEETNYHESMIDKIRNYFIRLWYK